MRVVILSVILISVLSIALAASGIFQNQKVLAVITDDRLVEASGLEESFRNPGYFWTHNDSGGKPILYLIDINGKIKLEVELKGLKNKDWEEIITVYEEGVPSIYVGEVGDNRGIRDDIALFRIEEPKLNGQAKIQIDREDIEVMPLAYKEGPRDAEAILYDFATKEFVLVTKREKHSMVYSFPFTPSDKKVVIESKGTVPSRNFTAADMNQEGEILLKHYASIFYWGESSVPAVDRLLDWDPISINYSPEPQGEAICWYEEDFYTISEKNKGKPQEMLIFKRLK